MSHLRPYPLSPFTLVLSLVLSYMQRTHPRTRPNIYSNIYSAYLVVYYYHATSRFVSTNCEMRFSITKGGEVTERFELRGATRAVPPIDEMRGVRDNGDKTIVPCAPRNRRASGNVRRVKVIPFAKNLEIRLFPEINRVK